MKSFAFAGLVLIALCAQSYAKSVRGESHFLSMISH